MLNGSVEKYSDVRPPSNKKAYSISQATINGLHTCGGEMLSNWKVVLYLGMIVFVMQTLKLNEKLAQCFSTLAWFLCRSNLRSMFLDDSSLAVFWVSFKFEERAEDTANFPLTLNNFFTSCARWHKNPN